MHEMNVKHDGLIQQQNPRKLIFDEIGEITVITSTLQTSPKTNSSYYKGLV